MQLQSSLLRPAASSSPASNPSSPTLPHRGLRRFRVGAGGRARGGVRVVCGNLGDRWKLRNIDPDAVQAWLSSWLLKAQTLITDVASPLVKPGQGRMPELQMESESVETKDLLMPVPELTVDRRTPNGKLSLEAAISAEQFSRMMGQTGRKMQKIFEAQAPEPIRNDARSFVEYCCFRYLSRDNSDVHPCLKEPAFQRLIFVTMLAWGKPYCKDGHLHNSLKDYSLQKKFVGEDAFVRIAPAIAVVADRSTAHHLFKALVGDGNGISLGLWMTYIAELCKILLSIGYMKEGSHIKLIMISIPSMRNSCA